MKLKLVAGGIAGSILTAVALIAFSGDEENADELNRNAVSVPEKSLLVSKIRELGDIKVAGPCYEGSRGNDVLPPKGKPASDCYILMSEGQDYLDARNFSDDVYLRVSKGTDSIYLGEGDDIIEVRGTFEVVLDAGPGENILTLPGLDVPDVSLRIEGEDIVLEGKRGSIQMRRQYPRDGQAAPIKQIIFRNRTLDASEIYTRAVDGQASDGDDVLNGTPGDDVIYPGRGNDKISALEGDDAIFYEGGNDTIMGSLEGVGDDSLSFPFRFSQVTVSTVDDRDMIVKTPYGTVTLQFQIFFPVGDERSNIERFIFKDGVYSDEEMRSAAQRSSETP